MNIFNKEAGVTLVELMIGMLVGLVVIGGVITVYVAVSKSSADTLKSSRLNQEMSALINVMANDIRRAGYWGGADPDNPQNNPFAQDGTTAIEVRNVSTDAAVTSGKCITYSYDQDPSGNPTNAERVGFKWDGGTTDQVEMRQSGATTETCAGTGWLSISDENTITIEDLTFTMLTKCVNASEPNNEDDDSANGVDDDAEFDCNTVTPSAGDITGEVHEVEISMTASLKDDSLVKSTLVQTVRVRNDVVRER